jgi:DNA-directed RNA polymerase I, II, and III subunit RPABC2
MSYFDEQAGGDASDDDKKNETSDESDTETNVDEEEEREDDEDAQALSEEEDDENDEAKGKEDSDVEEGDGEDGEDDDKGATKKDEEADDEGDEEIIEKGTRKNVKKIPTKQKASAIVYDEDEDEDPTGEGYLQKFDKEINDNYIVNFHPESAVHNYDEILVMTKIIRDTSGIIIDDLHKTIPFLTKYEKARVLGQRAKQINSGASVFVKVPEKVIDGYLIAELELIEKRIPFIIRRPLPNGGSEYWSIKDLENISF